MSERKEKPYYDEQALARVLEAAYILQEHRTGAQKLGVKSRLTVVSTPERASIAQPAPQAQASPESSLEADRASMIATLEKLRPNLAALLEMPAQQNAAKTVPPVAAPAAGHFACRHCGHELVGDEQFCGECGTARSRDYEPPSMQAKTAAMWHMQQDGKHSAAAASSNGAATRTPVPQVERMQSGPLAEPAEQELPDLFEMPEIQSTLAALREAEAPPVRKVETRNESTTADSHWERNVERSNDAEQGELPAEASEFSEGRASVTALARTEHDLTWTSAAQAREYLENVAATGRKAGFRAFWNARRGDIYLALAVILVAGVIRWGIWSDLSTSAHQSSIAASHRGQTDPNADLSTFDKMLISLGLAEAPDAPVYKGNPDTQVWVDTRTALYYCPGTDLYGKTPEGKFSSQHAAQLDQYEPALRRACD